MATGTVVFFKWRSSSPKYRQSIPPCCFARHNLVRISKEECFQVIKSSRNSLSGMPSREKNGFFVLFEVYILKYRFAVCPVGLTSLSLLFCFGSSCVVCISLWLEMGHRVPLPSTPLHLCPTSLLDCLPTRTLRWVSSAKAWCLRDGDSELASGVGWSPLGLLDH